jgi:hypothetical protein
VTFNSTSSDPDSYGGQDTVRLFVCATASFDTTNDTCNGTELGSTTVPGATSDASVSYTIKIPTQDQNYGAYGYVVDNHGFEATGGTQGSNSVLTVNNVAPTTSPSTISVNGGADMTLTQESGETTGFTLEFTVADDNSCINAASSSEITGYGLSLYRSGVGSTTCDITSGAYDPNDCYTSAVATTTWNISCTASSTSCTGNTDTTEVWDCTFPLWYVADPTDATATLYSAQDWRAQVQGIDDNNATGSLSESDTGVDVSSLLAFALNTLSIPYGSLEPGQQTDPLSATTTLAATGNVGVDTKVDGQSMCTTYTNSTPCPNSASSTIPEHEQVFATDTLAYAAGTQLSSTTQKLIPIHVPKSTATSSAATGNAFWGIAVPGTITFAGDYTGQNAFTAVVSSSTYW